MKFKFLDRLTALALIGKACHWYADRHEQIGPDGGPTQKTIEVRFVSPKEAYDQMIKDNESRGGLWETDHPERSSRKA